MEFFNKKQDVLDIQITPLGKHLISKGLFKPTYYSFSDDGIIYDTEWSTGSLPEEQSSIETRIQENTPRLKTQYTKEPAEKSLIGIPMNIQALQEQLSDLFEYATWQDFFDNKEELGIWVDSVQDEKLLENTLGIKSPFDQYNPSWNALFYHGKISGSIPYCENNDIIKNIPQLNCKMTDIVYKFHQQQPDEKSWKEHIGTITNITSKFGPGAPELDDFFESLTLNSGDELFILKDFLFLSIEESSVDYLNENFELEVFEVLEQEIDGKTVETWKKMKFSDTSGINNNFYVNDIFAIEVDEEVDNEVACYLIGSDKDPYVNLPKTNVEDVC